MYSGGIGSWAAAQRIVDLYGASSVTLLFSDVKGDSTDPLVGEDPDLYRFLKDSSEQLGCELVRVADGRDMWTLFKDIGMLGNSRLAPCSKYLKQIPAKKWLAENTTADDTTVVIGIDWTETHRIPAVEAAYAPYKVLFPMCDEPRYSKEEMILWAFTKGLLAPTLYAAGFPHNNCGGACVRAGQGQFKKLLDKKPALFDRWEQEEKSFQEHTGTESTILLKRENNEDRRYPLSELRTDNTVDEYDIGGCGCFLDDQG
jgi:hypothetical protein